MKKIKPSRFQREILAAVTEPLPFPRIERMVSWQKGQPFWLPLALAKLVERGYLSCFQPPSFAKSWPVYSRKPLPKKFKFPDRDQLPPNARLSELPWPKGL